MSQGLTTETADPSSTHLTWPADENGWLVKPDGKAYIPTKGQAEFHADPAVIRLLIGGRGSGKTAAGSQEAGLKIAQGQPGLILAPDSEHFKKSTWVQLNEWIPIDPEMTGLPMSPLIEHWSKGDKYIRFKTGAQVWYGGIKDPDSWRGPNVNWIWYDEPGRHPYRNSFLVPIGSLRVGNDPSMWLTTTPRGVLHWLYSIFVKKELDKDVMEALVEGGFPNDPNLLLSWVRTSTFDNRPNLSPIFFAMLLATYQGRWREQELEGKWVSFEGLVYDVWDPSTHILDLPKIMDWWPKWRVVDFGYKNPFVCQWWTRNPEGEYIMYREIYQTQRTVNDLAQEINRLTGNERILSTICDHDAEDRATLEEHGIETEPAIKDISRGIQATYAMLAFDELRKPDIYLVRDALVGKDPLLVADDEPTSTADEFPRYAWHRDREGKPRKELPLDLYNHGMDSVRYMVATIEGLDDFGLEVGNNPMVGYRG